MAPLTRRVVVTGVGLVCALGIGTEETWKNLLAGQSGVAAITLFDPTCFDCRIAGEVKGFDLVLRLPHRRRGQGFRSAELAGEKRAQKNGPVHSTGPGWRRLRRSDGELEAG